MDIGILSEFVSLVETNSFQETAYEMNISQSALTKHIQKLESELGITLFDRSVRSIKTNDFGKALYPYAKQMMGVSQEAIAVLQELSNDRKKTFSVAYAPVLGQYGLVDLIAEFTKSHSDRSMKVIETYQPLNLLKTRKCDFAFLGGNEAVDENFNKMVYKTDHLAVVLPLDHPCAKQQSVTLEELEGERFILHASVTSIPHEETQKFQELCENRNFTPEIAMESQFTSTMVQYVRSGGGVAVLNRLHIPAEAKNTCAVVDIFPIVRSYIYLLYRRRLSSPAATNFLHFMIEKIGTEGGA
ncbi:MAG: LysR family transcriptional regulator [Lachnospiraceae bacterium]|nr:LysR family transcriptional regulator [Lachnospiraceae bacterium]